MADLNHNTPLQETPNDTQSRIDHLIALTKGLSELFRQENSLLSSQRASDIAPLQEEKMKLATAYASAIRDIASNRNLVDRSDDPLLTSLRDVTTTFNRLAEEQKSLLEGVHQAGSAVIQTIAQEARQHDTAHHPAANGYGHNGKTNQSSRPVVVSMNERA